MAELVGIGLYTPAEAQRLLDVPAGKISRWLRGHRIREREYPPLWTPQVDIEDDRLYLGFRDLMEVRVAAQFIRSGVSPQRVRAAINLAREIIGQDRPLSTERFRTDGRNIFLQVLETDESGNERERLIELFRRQYAFREIMAPLLKPIDFDEQGAPALWWPRGRQVGIVVDPKRAFGQPIDDASCVPTAVLAAAARVEGAPAAARSYRARLSAVRHAVEFEVALAGQLAA